MFRWVLLLLILYSEVMFFFLLCVSCSLCISVLVCFNGVLVGSFIVILNWFCVSCGIRFVLSIGISVMVVMKMMVVMFSILFGCVNVFGNRCR